MAIARYAWLITGLAFAFVAPFAELGGAHAQDGRVEPAERFFVDGPPDVPLSIRLPQGQTLTFDEKFNDRYVTNGRELRIRVSKIQVIGNPVVRIWSPTSAAPGQPEVGAKGPNGGHGGNGGYPSGGRGGDGQVGAPGPVGLEGAHGRDITIEVDEITGDGKLTLVTAGQIGGLGGSGGRGGDGGQGGDGRNRKDSGVCCFPPRIISGEPPGNGGQGGNGGKGRTGGTGGTGGAAGNVYHYAELCPLIKSSRISLILDGGSGG